MSPSSMMEQLIFLQSSNSASTSFTETSFNFKRKRCLPKLQLDRERERIQRGRTHRDTEVFVLRSTPAAFLFSSSYSSRVHQRARATCSTTDHVHPHDPSFVLGLLRLSQGAQNATNWRGKNANRKNDQLLSKLNVSSDTYLKND